MRKKTALFVIWALAIGGYVVVNQSPAPGAALPAFSGFSTGTNVHGQVLRTAAAGPVVADAGVAFSGAAVSSTGFAAGGIHDESNIAVVPAGGAPDAGVDSAGEESFGKGTGLEVGLGTTLPNDDLDQIVPGGRAEAAAQPVRRSDAPAAAVSATDTGDVDTSLIDLTQASPLLYLRAAFGHARARFDENQCVTDGPLSEGTGEVAKAELVDSAANAATPDLDAPLVATSSEFFGPSRGAVHTASFSYLVPNGDGTFGLATETHMTFAPISLLQSTPAGPQQVFIEILGEWVFQAVATGKPNGAFISYTVEGVSSDPDTPVIRVYIAPPNGNTPPTLEIKRSDLFTDQGIPISVLPLLDVTLGEDPRAITAPNALPNVNSSPTEAADGTQASGAADVIRITAINPTAPLDTGPEVLGLRIGHLEAQAQVPAGGIVCPAAPTPTTTTTTAAGATTTTTAAGATTTTTAPGGPGATTTTTAPGSTTTTGPPPSTTTTVTVLGQQFSRGVSPGAQPVTAQPRFTG